MARIAAAGICWLSIGWAGAALAQSTLPAQEGQAKPDTCQQSLGSKQATRDDGSPCLRYSWGLSIRAGDIGGDGQSFRLRPSLGLEYGRWSLGVLSADDWLGYSGLRKQSSLSYRLSDSTQWRTRISLSAVNVNTGEGLGSLEGGRYTLRGRVSVGYQYSPLVQMGGDISHDLLKRGAGTALTLGATRNIPWSDKTMLSISASTTIGNADYWNGSTTQQAISAGWGSVGLGLGMRHKLSNDWVWFSQMATNTPVGVVRDAGDTRTSLSGRVGFIKFGAW
jgi:hypothetical protein